MVVDEGKLDKGALESEGPVDVDSPKTGCMDTWLRADGLLGSRACWMVLVLSTLFPTDDDAPEKQIRWAWSHDRLCILLHSIGVWPKLTPNAL